MSEEQLRYVADAIASDLFETGFGDEATRLVLFDEDLTGDLKRNLGGWNRTAVSHRVHRILAHFAAHGTLPDAGRKDEA